MKNRLNYRLINVLLMFAIIYILYLTSNQWGLYLSKILSVSFPFLVGFAIAYILNPFVKFLESKGARRNIAITSVLILVFGFILGVIWLTLPVVYEQLISLSRSIISIIGDVSTKFDINLGEFSNTIMDTLNKLISGVGDYISNGTVTLVNKGIKFVTNLVIIVVVGIYFLVDMDKIRGKIKDFFKKIGKREFNYVKKLDTEITNYFKGLVMCMVIQFFEYSILYKLIGHPNWLLLGLLDCVTSFIPYFGGYITNCVALITASTVSMPVFIGTLVILLVFPNIDGYIISPKIYGRTNRTNPVIAIFMIVLFSSLFGFVGILIAMPTYVIIKATYEYFEKDIRKKIVEFKDNLVD